LGDELCATKDLAKELPLYPLDVAQCFNCEHVFLPTLVSWNLSDSETFAGHLSPNISASLGHLADNILTLASNGGVPLVIDIGSSSGAWLSNFKDRGATVLGLEVSKTLADQANANGIETLDWALTHDSVYSIHENYGVPNVITANFVVANESHLHHFFSTLRALAGDQTVISILTGYHPDQFRANMFDYVYHEHASYFTVQDFLHIGERFGFSIVGVQRLGLKGGSLQVLLKPDGSGASHHPDVLRMVQYERWIGICQRSWFDDFRARVSRERSRTHQILDSVNARKTLGYGMSHSATTLLYHFDLFERVSALVDDNEVRQGLFSPGVGIPILSPEGALLGDFDTVVILAWQHDRLIRKRLTELDWSGNIVQPLPGASLIRKGD
jgi:hypothetical protein